MEVYLETRLTEFQLELCELQSDPLLLQKKNGNKANFLEVGQPGKIIQAKRLSIKTAVSVWEYPCKRIYFFYHLASKTEDWKSNGKWHEGFLLQLAITSYETDMKLVIRRDEWIVLTKVLLKCHFLYMHFNCISKFNKKCPI